MWFVFFLSCQANSFVPTSLIYLAQLISFNDIKSKSLDPEEEKNEQQTNNKRTSEDRGRVYSVQQPIKRQVLRNLNSIPLHSNDHQKCLNCNLCDSCQTVIIYHLYVSNLFAHELLLTILVPCQKHLLTEIQGSLTNHPMINGELSIKIRGAIF